MKKLILFALILISGIQAVCAQEPATPRLKFVMQLKVTCSEMLPVGETPHGIRQSIPITGGTFSGPEIQGKVLPGGADYQMVHPQYNRADLEAIYHIQTNDGVNIHVRNIGFNIWDKENPYFVTTPKFQAPENSPYAWLNSAIFVCKPDANVTIPYGVVLNVWKVE